MRPELDVVRLRERRHLGDVAVEHFEIEHEGRCVERSARTLLADQVTMETLGFDHFFSSVWRLRTTIASPVVPRLTPAVLTKTFSLPVPHSATPCASRPPSTFT